MSNIEHIKVTNENMLDLKIKYPRIIINNLQEFWTLKKSGKIISLIYLNNFGIRYCISEFYDTEILKLNRIEKLQKINKKYE